MKKYLKQGVILIIVLALMISMVGCKQSGEEKTGAVTEKNNNGGAAEESGEKVYPKVSWYIRPSEQADMEKVVEALNVIFREKVGAELDIKRIDPGDYLQRMTTTIAANETFDMMHSAPRYNYYENVAKGAYLPLDELLKEYAPKTYASMPEVFWDAARVDGKIYGVINYQIFGRQHGFYVRKDVYETLNLDEEEIKTFEDMDAFLPEMEKIAGDKDIVFNLFKDGAFKSMLTYYDLDPIDQSIGVVEVGDSDPEVVNRYATEDFEAHIKLVNKWYQAGYIPKGAPTQEYSREWLANGNVMCTWDDYKPGNEYEKNIIYGAEMVYIPIEDPFVNTSNVIATMTSLSRNSENPEKAMQILELVNTDPEVYNLLINGIEGEHYEKTGDNRIEPVENSGYAPNCGWMVGNQFNAFLLPGQPDDVWEQTIRVNEKSNVSSIMGFTLDVEPIKNEMVQCQSVIDEFLPGLLTGAFDPDEFLPMMLEKLDAAGVQKIIEEENKQIDEWLSKQ